MTATGFAAYENVHLTWYSSPVFAGWYQADASGTVTVTLAIPPVARARPHVLQFTGTSGRIVALQVTVVALAASGADGDRLAALGALLLGGGALVLVLGRRRATSRAVSG